MLHFIFAYPPMPSDDWIYAIIYFNSVNIDATSWLFVYDMEAM